MAESLMSQWPRINGHTPGPWRAANGKGVASVKGPECAIYLNVRTVEVDDCVQRWQADARVIENIGPHLCDVPDCPGPRLVAKLEAAEGLAAEVRKEFCACLPKSGLKCGRCRVLAAWDSAGEGR